MSTDRLVPTAPGVRGQESGVGGRGMYRSVGLKGPPGNRVRISVHPTTRSVARSNRRLAKMSTDRLTLTL